MIPVSDELVTHSLEEMIDFCFPPELFTDPFHNTGAIADNVLLCTKNVEVDRINDIAMTRMLGKSQLYSSIDTPLDNDDPLTLHRSDFNIESVNNECPSGMPAHNLILKVKMIFKLYRNNVVLFYFVYLGGGSYYAT